MLERMMSGFFGLGSRGVLLALGLVVAAPTTASVVGCKKEEKDDKKDDKKKDKDDDDDKDSKKKKKSKDDDDDKDTKKKKSKDDDDDKSAKKKSKDDDDDVKTVKKGKALKSVDDEEEDDDAPKLKTKKAAGDSADIVGTYEIAGKNPDGGKYKGSATISKIGGSMYKGKWKIGSTNWEGVMFRDKNVLSCGSAPKHDTGVVAYLVNKTNLDGVWFEENDTKIGKEILSAPKDIEDLTGTYGINTGETPAKKKYTGTVKITKYKSGVYGLTWKFGTTTNVGLGLRSQHLPAAAQDLLSVGFNSAGDATVLQYVILDDGKTLAGHWAMPSKGGGEPSWGKETMTR